MNSDADIFVMRGVDNTTEEWNSTKEKGELDQVTISDSECGFYTIEVVGINEGENIYELQVSSYEKVKLFRLENAK